VERVVILGAEDPFTIDVLETLGRLKLGVVAGVMLAPPRWDLAPLAVVLQDEEVSDLLVANPVVLSGNAPRNRRRALGFATSAGFSEFPAIVDPTAVIASSARLGDGVYVNTLGIVAGHVSVGAHAVINRAASVGHHSVIEDFCMLGPNAVVGSNCRICEGAMLGAGAAVRPDTVIGPGSVIGTGAVVVKDVEANAIVVGNPGRVIDQAPNWAEANTGPSE